MAMVLRSQPSFWKLPQPSSLGSGFSAPPSPGQGSALTGSPASPFSPGSPGFPLSPWNTEQIKVRRQIPFISKKLVRRTLYLRTKKVQKAIPSGP